MNSTLKGKKNKQKQEFQLELPDYMRALLQHLDNIQWFAEEVFKPSQNSHTFDVWSCQGLVNSAFHDTTMATISPPLLALW